MQPSHLPIVGTPYTIDVANSDEEYLYVELKQGVTVVIKATDEGIVIDAFPQHTQDGTISEPVTTTWATWSEFLGDSA
jgi:hypothetical protein